MFQFLIGTLKTSDKLYRRYRNEKVSIPYRNAKNREKILKKIEEILVSIPYRNAKNPTLWIYNFLTFDSFNSL